MALLDPVRTGASTVGGALLATATRSVAAVRTAPKPLHPRGVVVAGRIFRTGLAEPTGSPWLDEPGEDEVLVRVSRAVGLPTSLPDIHGVAIRVPAGESYGDLLFASTGWGRLTRFLLTAGMTVEDRPMTTLLPYRTESGPVLLGVRAAGTETFELACAPYDGDWRHVADLRLSTLPAPDQDVDFDPVQHQLPGLEQYPSVARLRQPAYQQARESRAGDPA
ncbi:hypothetical protein [Nocardioides sp.]|uniref:hypothetical protein n=1 Tax=Nocardioides sp. TaxID=35761 RepID=UPI0031FF4197|nr:putative phosphodiesterase [Nocardioides sp.]